MAIRMEDWGAGDFYVAFHDAAKKPSDTKFGEKLEALGRPIEPLQREFGRETMRCGRDTAALMEDLDWIAAEKGYCERSRGFEKKCGELYGRVCRASYKVNKLRESCFI